MPWYRVLVESSGRIRGAEGEPPWSGAFTTRNVEAASEEEAGERAIARVHEELGSSHGPSRADGTATIRSAVVVVREVEGPCGPGSGFAFHTAAPEARDRALEIELAVFERAPGRMSPLRRLWRRLTAGRP